MDDEIIPLQGILHGRHSWPASSGLQPWHLLIHCTWTAPGSDRILWGTGAGPLLLNTSILSFSLQYHWLVPYQSGLDFLGTPVMNEALIQIPLLCEWGGAAEAWSADNPWVSTEQLEPPSCSTAEGALGNKEKKNRMCLGWCSLHVWGEMAWSGNTDKLCVSRS